jgi:hypothetical protein
VRDRIRTALESIETRHHLTKILRASLSRITANMKFQELALSAAVAATAVAADQKDGSTSRNEVRQAGFLFTGVNEAGAEFGQNTLPGQLGKHYTWPVPSTIDVSSAEAVVPDRKRNLTDFLRRP